MKNVRTVVTVLAAAALLAAGSGLFACKKKEPETIKIGAILPLTGDAANYGQSGKKGIEIALKHYKEDRGAEAKKIEVIYEDDKAEPKDGVSAYKKLVEMDRVVGVIGPMPSSVTLAVAPYTNDEKVPILSPASSAPKITEAGKYVFRNYPSDTFEGKVLAEFAFNKLGYTKAAIIHANTEYGVGLADYYTQTFKKAGGVLVQTETYQQGETDFRTQLLKIKKAAPEVLLIVGHIEEIVRLLKQKDELGVKTPVLGPVSFNDPKLSGLPKEITEGIIFSTPTYDPKNTTDERVVRFVSDFKAEFNAEPDIWAGLAYDAAAIYFATVDNEEEVSAERVTNDLTEIKDFPGVTGLTSFDENGDVEKKVDLYVVKEGEFVKYGSI